jgi:SPRY domain-containing SOCS box protein 1/4
VALKVAPLSEPGYKRLIGSNDTSWGWCLKTKKIYHDSRKFRNGIPYPKDLDEKLKIPESFYLLLDADRGTLSFQVDNDFLGVAFSGLRGMELFPVVSAVWGHCEVTLKYIGGHEFSKSGDSSS